MKKLLYAFLIAAVAAVHSGCKDDEETFVHVEKVSIDVRELHLNPGKTYQLSVTIEPADATNRRIAWYSSNTNVATVDKSGLVTALAFGEVTLTAEANDMHVNDAIRLTIDDVDNSIPIESLTLDATSKTFDFAADPGVGAFRFAPAILPENATNKKLKWTSDDPLVAGIDDNGLLVPVSHGKTTIRVSTTDGGNKTARCEVTVIGVKDRNYDSADDYYKIIYFPVNITVKDENGQDTEQTWLDRNLGAKGIAAASNDHTAFGSLFQWSRKADGHEKTKWTSATAGSFVNAPPRRPPGVGPGRFHADQQGTPRLGARRHVEPGRTLGRPLRGQDVCGAARCRHAGQQPLPSGLPRTDGERIHRDGQSRHRTRNDGLRRHLLQGDRSGRRIRPKPAQDAVGRTGRRRRNRIGRPRRLLDEHAHHRRRRQHLHQCGAFHHAQRHQRIPEQLPAHQRLLGAVHPPHSARQGVRRNEIIPCPASPGAVPDAPGRLRGYGPTTYHPVKTNPNITMKKSVLLLLLSALFTCGSVYAQLRVTGTVLDAATGEPMAGASVIEQGTTSGTTPDTQGRFAISVKNHQSVLTFSFIGMAPQNIMVGSNTDLRVELQQDVTQIENVVVQIGYGDAQKKNVAGSLGVLSTSEITKSKGTSFMDALQGRMAGVQVSSSSGEPGAGIDITIRGGNSINAGTQPLYIIDDVQIDVNADEVATSSYTSANVRYNPLAGINPSDIESITVLKDASATAIYGSRGANGVVIITTKSGRGEKASVDFDMSVGLARMSNTIDVLQGQEFADYRFAKFPTSDAWGIDTNGDGLPDRVRDFSASRSRNWQEEVMRTGIIQSYNIGVASGGSAKTKVAASAGYLNQEGIVKKNQMERFTGRIRFDSDLSKRFTIGGTINFSHIVTKGAVTNAGANSYNGLVQSFVLYKPIFLSEDDDEASNPENYNLTNPITFINDSYKASTQNRTIGDLYLKYKILKNLTLRISGGGTILNSKTEEWYPSTTSWGYSKNGMAVVAESGAESWQTSNTLTYAISRGKHYLNAVLGFELRGYTATRLSTRAEGFENQSFNGAFDIGQGSVFPENVQTNRERNTSESEFLRLNYTLAEKYIFTASIRRDGSSKFGKNNKYGYFPSAAFAWSIGKEEFMKQQKIFSDMKLRLSYGVTGNDRIPAYQSLSRTDKTYYSGDNNSVQLGLSPSEISNPDLKWETTYQLNGGLDISMFRNRLSIEADVYYKKTKDMLLHADVPSQIGSYRQWQNIGQVDNKGFELTINTVNIQKRNFTWSTSLNFNLNRNKVVSLGDVSSIPVKVAGGHITEVGRVMVGHPIGSGWGYVFDGIYQQSDFDERGNLKEGVPSFAGITVKPGDMKFKDIAGNDNVIDPNNDKTVIANSDPKHFGGMTNSFTFKNFDLSFMFQWSYGNDIINIGRYRYEGFVGYNNVSTDYWRNRWTEERPGNRYPSLNGEGKTEMSSYYVEDGSYLRLKNLTVGYTLPTHITRKIGLSHLRVYVTAENLFTCTGYSGYDPEVSFWNRLIPGLDYTNYPRARSVFFGFSIKY